MAVLQDTKAFFQPTLRQNAACAFVASLSLMIVLLLAAEPAFAQNGQDGQDNDGALAMQVQNPAATGAEGGEAAPAAVDGIVSGEASASAKSDAVANDASQGEADGSAAAGVETPTDNYQASIVVGEGQKREYDGTAIGEDEYYVEVNYEGGGETVRYFAGDEEDVSGFTFLTESGELLGQPPVNAGIYRIRAQLLPTSAHTGRALESPFEITKQIVPVPAAPVGLVYTGEEQKAIVETDLYFVEGGSATEAGEYTARLQLKDPENYAFAGTDVLSGHRLGFFEMAWAIGSAAANSDVQRPEYRWEVVPAGNPDLTFGSAVAETTPASFTAKVTVLRNSGIDRLSAALLGFVKFARALFPNAGL